MSNLRPVRAAGFGTLALFIAAGIAAGGLCAASPQERPASTVAPEEALSAMTQLGEPVVQAVWKPQEFDFHYHSFTTFYSCNSLSDKVRAVLRELGADPQSRVRVSGCEFGAGIARVPFVRIKLSAPVEATAQALAELEKTRPQRELAARVRNDRAQGIAPAGTFPAYWKRVSLSRKALDLDPGDCELIEQLARQVLPRLAVRIIDRDLQCMPNQMTLRQPRLEVEALVELPKADTTSPGIEKKKEGSS